MKKITSISLMITLMFINACVKDLDVKPLNPNIQVSTNVFKTADDYKKALAKVYMGLATTGQQGPAGKPDIYADDEGFAQYLRLYWNLEELSTDEAFCQWNDNGVRDFKKMNWGANNPFLQFMYYRIMYQISLANQFIREASDDNLSSRNISDKAAVKTFKAEARFLRALSYWHGIDLFGNLPFVTDADPVGFFNPKQKNKSEIFNYLISELNAIENELPDAKTNEYGRVDKVAAQFLKAKLYLNAKVYTGTEKNTECITECNKIFATNYKLVDSFKYNFLADNDIAARDEIIFPIALDAVNTQTWGSTTFLINASIVGNATTRPLMGLPENSGGWNGLGTTKQFFNKFDNENDLRGMFYKEGRTLDITTIETNSTGGYQVIKFKNVKSDGKPGKNSPAGSEMVDTDFPMFRLADAYLMYAEAVVRGGSGGDMGKALGYVNQLRRRGYQKNMNTPDVTIDFTSLTLDNILDERARELYWECHRRTDLIRFGKFTTGYNWAMKGGVIDGTDVDDKYKIYPFPSTELIANPTIVQNVGY